MRGEGRVGKNIEACVPPEKFDMNIKMATTYSPTFYSSTIGAAGLNCSVRNGKRCTPAL
jgi:hypothetical protein